MNNEENTLKNLPPAYAFWYDPVLVADVLIPPACDLVFVYVFTPADGDDVDCLENVMEQMY